MMLGVSALVQRQYAQTRQTDRKHCHHLTKIHCLVVLSLLVLDFEKMKAMVHVLNLIC